MRQIIIILISTLIGFAPLPIAEVITPIKKPVSVVKPIKAVKIVKLEQVANIVQTANIVQPIAPTVAPVVTGSCADWMTQAGIVDQVSAYALIMRESGCRVNASNPSSGAYGIPQSLPASKMASIGSDYLTNPVTQLIWMKNYVEARYGSFANALSFSYSNNWY